MCRRGGSVYTLEIPPSACILPSLSDSKTMRVRQFDWGGRLLKSNGGVRR